MKISHELNEAPVMLDRLFGMDKRRPYYIYCYPIKLQSAGITALHRLCHMLNLKGYPAFMICQRELLDRCGYPPYPTHSRFISPELSLQIAMQHQTEMLDPIVIYPDVASDNPLHAPTCLRYLLNYPGELGGSATFPSNELVFSYSQKIANHSARPENVLFVPASDPDIFYPPAEDAQRKGICFYASKYQHFYGGKVGEEVKGAFEITRDLPTSLKKQEIADLLRRSEFLYCYENSALAIEAALCGCPVVFMPSEHFSEVIGEFELGKDGFAWGNSPEEMERARNTVHLFRPRYMTLIENVDAALDNFIAKSQAMSRPVKREFSMNRRLLNIVVGTENLTFTLQRFFQFLDELNPVRRRHIYILLHYAKMVFVHGRLFVKNKKKQCLALYKRMRG